MCLGTATAAASLDDLAARTTSGRAENRATGMSNVLVPANLKIGGVAINNVALSDRSQHEPWLQPASAKTACGVAGEPARRDCIAESGFVIPPKCMEQIGVPPHRGCEQAASASKGCAAVNSTRVNTTNWNNLFICCIDFRPTQHA